MLGMPAPARDPLTVLAHPLRARLHHLLRVAGPDTATGLARRLDCNSGATSYHLRQLAAAGLITDSGRGRGRRRLWEANDRPQPGAIVAPGSAASAAAGGERGEPMSAAAASLLWLERDVLAHVSDQAERWLDASTQWPPRWRSASATTAEMVLVSPAGLAELRAEMDALLRRYRRRGQGNPKARRVAVYTVCVPLDLERPPGQPGV